MLATGTSSSRSRSGRLSSSRSLRSCTRGGAVLDCHLMVDNPEHHFAQIAKAGGDSVTFHHEVVADVAATAAKARELGLGVGLAFNPESEVADVVARVEGVDLVLCMSIHPGYSGQAFMPEALERIRELREALGGRLSTCRSTAASRQTTSGRRAKRASSSWSPGARSSTASTRARPTGAWSTQLRDKPSSRGRSSSPSGAAARPGRIRWSGPSSCATARWSARGGTSGRASPHAEALALESAGERARGATLYVTLEPCAHQGRTPPCADAVVAAGISRVVAAIGDPDPRTRRPGLRAASGGWHRGGDRARVTSPGGRVARTRPS